MYQIDQNILLECNNLKYICTPTTGLNHIDLDFIFKKNIKVISLKGEVEFLEDINATPEHTIGLIFSLLRFYGLVYRCDSQENWNRDLYRGDELSELNVGLIGLGRVGLKVAKFCNFFSPKINWFDPYRDSNLQEFTQLSSVNELIDQSQVIILSASYDPNNRPILNYENFLAMKGKYFINTARGELIDEDALYQLAVQGWFAGIALDVIKDEQQSLSRWDRWRKIRDFQNIIVTPHIGGCTINSMARTEIFIVNKLWSALCATK
jgi:D-3-phosphoglycerate dehydrogenase